MAATYDRVLRGGIVVNQDGAGERDIGIRRRPHRGDRHASIPRRPAR